MKTVTAALLALLFAGPAWAGEGWKTLHVSDLAELHRSGKAVTVLDANTPGFRTQNGTIPGAKLLSSFKNYDLAKELPADKSAQLVFYCADTH